MLSLSSVLSLFLLTQSQALAEPPRNLQTCDEPRIIYHDESCIYIVCSDGQPLNKDGDSCFKRIVTTQEEIPEETGGFEGFEFNSQTQGQEITGRTADSNQLVAKDDTKVGVKFCTADQLYCFGPQVGASMDDANFQNADLGAVTGGAMGEYRW